MVIRVCAYIELRCSVPRLPLVSWQSELESAKDNSRKGRGEEEKEAIKEMQIKKAVGGQIAEFNFAWRWRNAWRVTDECHDCALINSFAQRNRVSLCKRVCFPFLKYFICSFVCFFFFFAFRRRRAASETPNI